MVVRRPPDWQRRLLRNMMAALPAMETANRRKVLNTFPGKQSHSVYAEFTEVEFVPAKAGSSLKIWQLGLGSGPRRCTPHTYY